jgi:hypothetical protein
MISRIFRPYIRDRQEESIDAVVSNQVQDTAVNSVPKP